MRRRSPDTLRRCRLPFGGNNPAAIGAGFGSLPPLRVSPLSREVTSWRVSQHRTVVLDNIPGYAFPVPEFILAFNRPNYHTVKLHSLPLSVPYQIIPPPRTPQRWRQENVSAGVPSPQTSPWSGLQLVPWLTSRLSRWWRRVTVEKLFRRLKGFRRVFSRFDKLEVMFLAFLVEALR